MSALSTSTAWYARNRFFAYDPMVSVVPFHQSRHRRRMVRAPNQSSKTYSAAWESWAHLIGRHRWQPEVRPESGWVLLADLEHGYPTICEKLRSLEPGDFLDPATRYITGKGYYTNGRRMIRTNLGHVMDFRSGEGETMALAMATIGWLWIDEVPKQPHFGEALSRVAVREGAAWMSFTPIGRPAGYLRDHVEGNAETGEPPREEWVQFRPQLTQADCTTVAGRIIRTEESIENQCAAYSPWELAQRRYGEWEGVSVGRRLSGFSESCVVDDDAIPATLRLGDESGDPDGGTDKIRISLDHGEGTGKQIAHLSIVTPQRIIVAHEWVGKANVTSFEVASGIVSMLDDLGLTIHHVGRIVGDVNSAGLAGGGATYNEFVERDLCAVLKLAALPVSITIPWKGRDSVSTGEGAMSHWMKEGRYLVHKRCAALIHAAKHYTGKEKDLKDPIDSARYGTADVLLAGRKRPRAEVLVV